MSHSAKHSRRRRRRRLRPQALALLLIFGGGVACALAVPQMLKKGFDRNESVSSEMLSDAVSGDSAHDSITTTKATTTTTRVQLHSFAAPTRGENGRVMIQGVPLIAQRPNFPTGCESASAVMAMQFAGASITMDAFVDEYLEKSSQFYYQDNVKYGPDPNKVFLGSPRSDSAYGCFAPVIRDAINRYYGNTAHVTDATGSSLEELCSRYIDQGIPVLTWVSIRMIAPYYSDSWVLPDGSTFQWPANEHCAVLVGYDNEKYYFNDPWTGAVGGYSRALSESRYAFMGKQALVVQ